MPYNKQPDGDGKFTVVNSDTGEVRGTYETEDRADRHAALLNHIDADASWSDHA